jgi:hypothetical protein
MTTFTSKLSSTRAGERTRIWIQGPRLTEAGFVPGLFFTRTWGVNSLTLELVSAAKFEKLSIKERGKVSGKGDLPIIDVTGALVASTFAGTHVVITYAKGKLTIKGAKNV